MKRKIISLDYLSIIFPVNIVQMVDEECVFGEGKKAVIVI